MPKPSLLLLLTASILGCAPEPEAPVVVVDEEEEAAPENTAPSCLLESPVDASVLELGRELALLGTVDDAEHGPDGLDVSWWSSRDGLVGQSLPDAEGAVSLFTDALSRGAHTLSLRAEDQEGGRCTESVELVVAEAPQVAWVAPEDGFSRGQELAIELVVAVSAPEHESTELVVSWSTDVDGSLGQSVPDEDGHASLVVDALSAEVHVLTARVEDPDGLAMEAELAIEVLPIPQQRVLVPAFFGPEDEGGYWELLIAGAPTVGAAILNPGLYSELEVDDHLVDPAFLDVIGRAQAEGISVIGYVPIWFGEGDLDRIEAEIDFFIDSYGVDGIFFDQATSAPCSWYAPAAAHVRDRLPGGLLVANDPRREATPVCHFDHVDVVTVFESDANYYKLDYQVPDYRAEYAPERFGDIVHTATSLADVLEVVEASQARDTPTGWLFVTTDTTPGSPYDTTLVGADWWAFLDAVAAADWD